MKEFSKSNHLEIFFYYSTIWEIDILQFEKLLNILVIQIIYKKRKKLIR